MGAWLRDGLGAVLVSSALGGLFYAVLELRAHDYLAAMLLALAGVAVLRAGVELLRPTVGE